VRQDLALLQRVLRIISGNLYIIPSLLRMEYRHRLGISIDRHFRPGYSSPPSNISVCLTMRCNLNCRMCNLRSGLDSSDSRPWYQPKRELPLESWITMLDQVAPFRPWIYLTGGEPLLSANFKEFVRAARQRHLVVHLQTNGTRLGEVAEFLVEAGVFAVSVSLDGPPDIHDEIRGHKGTFNRVQEGIKALLEARRNYHRPGPLLGLNCTISRANLEYLPQMVEWAATLQVDVLQIQHTMFNSPEKVDQHNEMFSPEQVKNLGLDMVLPSIRPGKCYQSEIKAEDLPKLHASLGKARKLARGRVKLVFMPHLPSKFIAPYYLDLDYPFGLGCDFFWKSFRVYPDGTCSPCLNLRVGNITEQSFAAIWNGTHMQRLRRFFANRLTPGCVRCCQRHYVQGSRAF
jgi:MoaA/NifB/PqqE/SkfB family radical SAM enzyme